MRRSDSVTFVEPNFESSRKQFCPKCEDIGGQFNKLVPRFVNGIKDDKFKICSYCGELYPIMDVRYFTEYEPKGYISDNPFDSGTRISVKSTRRKARHEHRDRPLPNEDLEIPKFAGRKDEFLERLTKEEGAVINSIQDSWTEEEDQ